MVAGRAGPRDLATLSLEAEAVGKLFHMLVVGRLILSRTLAEEVITERGVEIGAYHVSR